MYLFQGVDDPLLVTDLGDIVDKWKLWKSELPRVKPFYGKYGGGKMKETSENV